MEQNVPNALAQAHSHHNAGNLAEAEALFRQERAGDWAGVFARMADALSRTAAGTRAVAEYP
ncbi:hypothetical protein [Azospirillum sp. sgz302134]